MKGSVITSSTDHIRSITKILTQLIDHLRANVCASDKPQEMIREIDRYSKEQNLFDQNHTVFDPEHDEAIGEEILKTYEQMKLEDRFTSVLQICDCDNLNLLEHIWSAILLVERILQEMYKESNPHLYVREFQFFIFLNLQNEIDKEILGKLAELIEIIGFQDRIKIVALLSDQNLDDVLYKFRYEARLDKVDLLLLLDSDDTTNLTHLKVVESLGLIQPRSFIISTSENLAYTRYVSIPPCEKHVLLRSNGHRDKHPGRWNLIYDTRCLRGSCRHGADVEMTRCVEYLDG